MSPLRIPFLDPYQQKTLADTLCKVVWETLTGRKYRRFHISAELEHYDSNGVLIWQGKALNALVDEGEIHLIKCAFDSGQSRYSTLYLGLNKALETTLGEAITLATMTSGNAEPSGTGYARQSITNNAVGWTYEVGAGGYQARLTTAVTFTNSGNNAWDAVQSMFLCSASSGNSGIVICTKDLSTSRTLQAADQLKCTVTVNLA